MYVHHSEFCGFSAAVIFSGIQPRVPSVDQNRATPSWIADANIHACEINSLLQAMANDRHLVGYVPHGQFSFNGRITRNLLARDGLHLSIQGITTLTRDITVCVVRLASTQSASPVIKSSHISPTVPTKSVSARKPWIPNINFTTTGTRVSNPVSRNKSAPAIP